MGFLAGKRALIVGLASQRSIAWGIAQVFRQQGAELVFTCQNGKLCERVQELAQACGSRLVLPCDLASDEQIAAVFDTLARHWDGLDIVVHSAAFAPKEELDGRFVDVTTRQGFRIAHDISSFSFTALAQAARPLMQGRRGALLTLSYLGAVRVVPHYNVMGLAKASLEASVRYLAADLGPEGTRVNAISAGPIRTLAASGIAGFRTMLDYNARNAPLRRNVTIEEVGQAAAFLCSDLASGISGQVLYVDAGYHVMGMGPVSGEA